MGYIDKVPTKARIETFDRVVSDMPLEPSIIVMRTDFEQRPTSVRVLLKGNSFRRSHVVYRNLFQIWVALAAYCGVPSPDQSHVRERSICACVSQQAPTLIDMANDRQPTAEESKGFYNRLKKTFRLGSQSTPQSRSPSAAPVGAAPVDAAPVDAAPVDAAPVDAAPVDAAPVDAAPPSRSTQ